MMDMGLESERQDSGYLIVRFSPTMLMVFICDGIRSRRRNLY